MRRISGMRSADCVKAVEVKRPTIRSSPLTLPVVEYLHADIVHVVAAVDARLHVRLGDDERIGRRQEGADLRRQRHQLRCRGAAPSRSDRAAARARAARTSARPARRRCRHRNIRACRGRRNCPPPAIAGTRSSPRRRLRRAAGWSPRKSAMAPRSRARMARQSSVASRTSLEQRRQPLRRAPPSAPASRISGTWTWTKLSRCVAAPPAPPPAGAKLSASPAAFALAHRRSDARPAAPHGRAPAARRARNRR